MLQRAILVAVILSANCVLFPTTSVALDGTDGCIGSVVQLTPLASSRQASGIRQQEVPRLRLD